MIVAGIGCRKGAGKDQVLAAVRHAVEAQGLEMKELGMLASGELKRHEPGIAAAASALDVPLMLLDEQRLRHAAPRCITRSAASMEIAGVPSLSEAAALAGAGPNGKLLAARIALDGVTCALARTVARGETP